MSLPLPLGPVWPRGSARHTLGIRIEPSQPALSPCAAAATEDIEDRAERRNAIAESSRPVRRKHSQMGPRIIHQAARAHRPGALRRAQGRDAASLLSTNTAVSDVDAQLRSNNIDNRPI